ncbi:MAG TPA: protein kinase [Gemmatimonadales bacterium]|jgi:serine/threonine-protein kinase|nr:protein kinase [Gemmatimonadales bacterium]
MGAPDGLRDALADRYVIERELGRGGMAVVYLAQDLRHDRPVALKILLPELAATLGPERFQREIRLAARLQHPHILTVHDSGETAGQLWFTMPFVEGESLRDRLRRERQLPVDDALRIATEAARALDYAHHHGVVHRDIKPENILLTQDGSTLVADFGIARALGGNDGLTQTGFAVGTPAYMSPEQAAGDRSLDPRTDLYSLGSVLYEMLAGEAPFTGPTAQAIAAKRLTEPPPSVRAVRPTVPPAVDEAIRKALAPVAADRFATVGQFAQALHVTSSGATAATTIPSPVAEAPRPMAAQVPRRRPVPVAAVALTAGLLIGGGLLFAWRRSAAGHESPGGTRVVAVLPFDNLGDSADAYFADGVSDEVRTKLGQVAGLEVIARGSSLEYRHTAKRATEIAHELGADYLLTGTVRWEKAGGTSRVRVTPELVDARPGQAARSRWGQQFDASLTDVFQVQADIATKVADALGVALADSTQRQLTAKPTENLAAYDEFLKGEAVSQGMSVVDPLNLRRAIGYYEQAVALDSTFAVAWARLSHARSRLYNNGVPDPALGEQARVAAERAQRLKPKEPLVYRAFGAYYGTIPLDLARALAEYQEGIRLAPDNVALLVGLAAIEPGIGRWDSAAARLAHAAVLDPRSVNITSQLADLHTMLRHYATADSAADRGLALAPTNPRTPWQKVINQLGRGDLDSARAVIRAAVRHIDPGAFYAYLATYQDLYWVLEDDAQRQTLQLPPSAFDDDRGNWGIVRAQLYYLRGDRVQAAIYADSARIAFEEQSRAAPKDPTRHALLGVALGYLGRKAEAVREGLRAVQMVPVSRDQSNGPYYQLQLVRTYLLVGEPEKALDHLESMLKTPYYLSPGWLRIDPTFDPLRNNPRFRKLVEGTA